MAAAGSAALVHGLVIAGDIPIAGAHAAPPGSVADLTISLLDAEPVPEGPPPGELVATFDLPGARYDATRDGDVLRMRFHGTASFDVDLATGDVEARPAPGREGMVDVLLPGNVIALILGLRGEVVLHASAVVADGSCTATIGPSGAGKSTLTYLLSGAGMRLLTDDTARVGSSNGSPAIHRGASEVRLRGPVATAARAGEVGEIRESADGRTVVRLPAADAPIAPIGRLLVPAWSEEAVELSVERLGERDTLHALLRSSRVAGWVAPEPLATMFDSASRLAATVPAHRLTMPRGGFEDDSLPDRVAECLVEADS